jgi:hypothetical protein
MRGLHNSEPHVLQSVVAKDRTPAVAFLFQHTAIRTELIRLLTFGFVWHWLFRKPCIKVLFSLYKHMIACNEISLLKIIVGEAEL